MFNRLFTEFFKLKTKYSYLLLIIQLLIALAISIFNYFGFTNGRLYTNIHGEIGFFSFFLGNFVGTIFLAMTIFYISTCFYNERLNHNQTWRLAPLNDRSFYLDNIFSSFVADIFFALLESISTIILFAVTMLLDSHFRFEVLKSFTQFSRGSFWSTTDGFAFFADFFSAVMLFILLVLFGYFVISFFNFSSQSIADFLPGKTGRRFVRFITVVLIILLAFLFVTGNEPLIKIIAYPLSFIGLDPGAYRDITTAIIVMLVLDMIFLAVNTILFARFFEAKEHH